MNTARLLATLTLVTLIPPLPASAAGEAEWTTLTFEASGPADAWVAFRQSIVSAGEGRYEATYTLVLEGSGPATGGFVLPPTGLVHDGHGLVLPIVPGAQTLLAEDLRDGAATRRVTGTLPVSAAGVEAAFAFGANAPWSVRLTYRFEGMPAAGAAPRVVEREGLVFGRATVPGPEGEGTLQLDVPQAGWAVFEMRQATRGAASVREHDVTFPSGFRDAGSGARVSSLVSASVDHVDALQESPGAAGAFHARVTWTGTGSGLVLAFASLQGSEAAFGDVAFRGWTDRL